MNLFLIMIFGGKCQLVILFFLKSEILLKKLFKLELFFKLAQSKLESLK